MVLLISDTARVRPTVAVSRICLKNAGVYSGCGSCPTARGRLLFSRGTLLPPLIFCHRSILNNLSRESILEALAGFARCFHSSNISRCDIQYTSRRDICQVKKGSEITSEPDEFIPKGLAGDINPQYRRVSGIKRRFALPGARTPRSPSETYPYPLRKAPLEEHRR